MSKVKLGDVAEEVKETYDGNGNPDIVGLEHLVPGDIRLKSWSTDTDNTFTKAFHKGQVLFGRRRAYLKKAAVAPVDGICSGDITVISAKQDKILPELLPFVIQNDDFFDYAVGKSAGSLSPRVKWSHLKEYEFNLPSLSQQKELANLLWHFVDAKEAYEDLIYQTDELVKSQFIEMFGDPINNDRGWDYKTFPEVTEIVLGSTPSTKKPEYWEGELKWITPAELTDTSFYVYDTEKHITELGAKDAGLKICPAETVLFSTRAPIGKTAIAGTDMYCNQGFKNFVCGPQIRPVYLYYLLTLKKDYFEGLGTGTTFKELSRGRLEKVSISVPPIDLQQGFEELYRQSDKSKFVLSYINKNIKELIQCLQKKIQQSR